MSNKTMLATPALGAAFAFTGPPFSEKMQEALGLSRGLHVISMMYEHNYEIALHAQNRVGDRIRSVVVPWEHITDGELDILTKSGVVGYRITWRLTKTIDQKMVARTTGSRTSLILPSGNSLGLVTAKSEPSSITTS